MHACLPLQQFVLLVTRQGCRVPSTIFREMAHFEELHKKLTTRFQLAPIPSLTEGSGGASTRSNIDRRKETLQNFINALLDMASEISEVS